MTLKIRNINYSETPPRSCGVKRLLDDESLLQKYLTLSLKFLAMTINQTLISGQSFWDGGSTRKVMKATLINMAPILMPQPIHHIYNNLVKRWHRANAQLSLAPPITSFG